MMQTAQRGGTVARPPIRPKIVVMWFSEKALVAVDSRGVAVAVYRETFSGPRLVRFGFEKLGARGDADGSLVRTLSGAGEVVKRLALSLRAPSGEATFLLPIGATFPSITGAAAAGRARAADVPEADFVRFRFASVLPFPVSQAEVRTESAPSLGPGLVLAQAALKSTVAAAEAAMEAWGFNGARISSVLSAAARGLPPRPETVDLILGDAACAVCARDARGVAEAIHIRLLSEGEDRRRRSFDEARRTAPSARELRIIGEDIAGLEAPAPEVGLVSAFPASTATDGADPQRFPFLSMFHGEAGRFRGGLPDFGSRSRLDGAVGFWRAVRVAGVAALGYAAFVALVEGRAAWISGRALNHARDEAARTGLAAEEARKALQKNGDVLTLVASVESSPARVRADLAVVLPPGVEVPSLKIDYAADGVARLDLVVLARSSDTYDRFLAALSKSPRFAEIRPGSEVRPGLVRATVTAVHRPERRRP